MKLTENEICQDFSLLCLLMGLVSVICPEHGVNGWCRSRQASKHQAAVWPKGYENISVLSFSETPCCVFINVDFYNFRLSLGSLSVIHYYQLCTFIMMNTALHAVK